VKGKWGSIICENSGITPEFYERFGEKLISMKWVILVNLGNGVEKREK
jgi:hypothetical protein